MKVVCESCNQCCTSITEWHDHLMGVNHQLKNQRHTNIEIAAIGAATTSLSTPIFVNWNIEENDRSIVVTEYINFVTETIEVLQHFSSFGFITDFIYDPLNTYAVIQFDQKQSVDEIMGTKNACLLRGRFIRVRRKKMVSLIECKFFYCCQEMSSVSVGQGGLTFKLSSILKDFSIQISISFNNSSNVGVAILDLNGKYDKTDQQFFVRHIESTASIANYNMDYQLQSFIGNLSLGNEGLAIRKTILRDLTYIVAQEYPKVFVYPLLPIVRGLEDQDGIYEMFMDPFSLSETLSSSNCNPVYVLPDYQSAIIHILYILQHQTVMPSCEKFCSEVTMYPENAFLGNRPSLIRGIKFYHKASGVRCNIHFDAVMSAHISSLLSSMMSVDIRIAPLIRFIHYWARLHRFTQRYPEITEVLTVMTIVYLARKNIIPSVSVLQKINLQNSSFVEGWDVSFAKDAIQIETHLMSFGKVPYFGDSTAFYMEDRRRPVVFKTTGTRMLIGFMSEFFTSFGVLNIQPFVISPFTGEYIPRRCFEPSSSATQLPSCFKIFKERTTANPLNVTTPMVVQHPFNHSRNMTEAFDEDFVNELQQQFRMTAARINKVLASSTPRIMDMFPESHLLLSYQPLVQQTKLNTDHFEPATPMFKNDLVRCPNTITTTTTTTPPSNPPRTVLNYSLAAKKAILLSDTPPSPREVEYNSNLEGSPGTSNRCNLTFLSSPLKVIKFEVNRRFKDAFMIACHGLGSEGRLKDRLKTLAIVFMRDFAWSIWGKSFYLQLHAEKISDTDIRFDEINNMLELKFPLYKLNKSNSNSDISALSDIPADYCPDDSRDNCDNFGDKSDFDEHEEDFRDEFDLTTKKTYYRSFTEPISASTDEPVKLEKTNDQDLRIKFAKIPKSACRNYCQILRLYGYQKIWANRRAIRTKLTLHDKPISMKEIPETSRNSDSLIGMPLTNPLEKEELVTRIVLDEIKGWGKVPAKRAVWSFTAVIRINTSNEYPTLFISLKEGKQAFISQNMINYFGNVLPNLFSEYMAYRLSKWLDNNCPPTTSQ